MSGFSVSFNSAANAMSAIQQALDAVQNNIVNASTPGYAAEQVNFSAQSFDPTQGLTGGVDVSLSSSRDQYLEQSVRTETSALGLLQQKSPDPIHFAERVQRFRRFRCAGGAFQFRKQL